MNGLKGPSAVLALSTLSALFAFLGLVPTIEHFDKSRVDAKSSAVPKIDSVKTI